MLGDVPRNTALLLAGPGSQYESVQLPGFSKRVVHIPGSAQGVPRGSSLVAPISGELKRPSLPLLPAALIPQCLITDRAKVSRDPKMEDERR